MKSFLAHLFGTGSQLSEMEGLVLDNVKDHLNAGIGALWDEQVQAINKVQRLPEGVEVNFYRMKNGRPSFEEKLAFTNKTEELLVARVKIGLPNVREKLTADVWCVKGFLFSIEYNGGVNYFEEAAGMDPRPEFLITCELTADLSQPNQITSSSVSPQAD